jgi:hypothetical protein
LIVGAAYAKFSAQWRIEKGRASERLELHGIAHQPGRPNVNPANDPGLMTTAPAYAPRAESILLVG